MSQYTPYEEEQGRIAKEILMEKGKLSSEEMPKHTPTPWKEKFTSQIYGGKDLGRFICATDSEDVTPNIHAEDKANAEFIVRAVNSHEALLEAAKRIVEFIDSAPLDWLAANQDQLKPIVRLVKPIIAQAEDRP